MRYITQIDIRASTREFSRHNAVDECMPREQRNEQKSQSADIGDVWQESRVKAPAALALLSPYRLAFWLYLYHRRPSPERTCVQTGDDYEDRFGRDALVVGPGEEEVGFAGGGRFVLSEG